MLYCPAESGARRRFSACRELSPLPSASVGLSCRQPEVVLTFLPARREYLEATRRRECNQLSECRPEIAAKRFAF
jgi:hypothetical protein